MSRTAYDADGRSGSERADALSAVAAERAQENRLALRAASDHRLSLQLSRPHRDRRSPALTMNDDLGITNTQLGFAAGAVLPDLHAVRSAEQSRALPFRCAALDRAHHDQLGPGLRRHGLVNDLTSLYVHAPSCSAHRRSRVLSRHRLFSLRLVPARIPHAHARLVPDRNSRHPSLRRRAALRSLLLQMDGILGLAGWKWLFIMVSLPCVAVGLRRAQGAGRPPRRGIVADAREEAGALKAMLAAETHDRPKTSVLGRDSRCAHHRAGAGAVRLHARVLRHRHLDAADPEGIPALRPRNRLPPLHSLPLRHSGNAGLGVAMRTGPGRRSAISRSPVCSPRSDLAPTCCPARSRSRWST